MKQKEYIRIICILMINSFKTSSVIEFIINNKVRDTKACSNPFTQYKHFIIYR